VSFVVFSWIASAGSWRLVGIILLERVLERGHVARDRRVRGTILLGAHP
jgi:hypothetical protein